MSALTVYLTLQPFVRGGGGGGGRVEKDENAKLLDY